MSHESLLYVTKLLVDKNVISNYVIMKSLEDEDTLIYDTTVCINISQKLNGRDIETVKTRY